MARSAVGVEGECKPDREETIVRGARGSCDALVGTMDAMLGNPDRPDEVVPTRSSPLAPTTDARDPIGLMVPVPGVNGGYKPRETRNLPSVPLSRVGMSWGL